MTFKTAKTLLLGAVATGTMMAAMPANAGVTILLNDVGGVTGTAAEQGFGAAAHYWESVLNGGNANQNITIKLNVSYAALGSGILGSTGSTRLQAGVLTWQGAIAGSGNSALDASVAANLPGLTNGGLTMVMPGYKACSPTCGINTATSRVDADGSVNNTTLYATAANSRALFGDATVNGLLGANPDASITFSSNFAFDFDPRDGITAGQYDFIGVAVHEIGHALGFTSGVDTLDLNGAPNGPNGGYNGNINTQVIGNLLDMFRYSADDTLNWRPGAEAYFSIDGGASELFGNSNFSTGRYNGDGQQASHWKANGTCANFIGILNPYLCDGTVAVVDASDLAVYDALGYNLNFNVLANAGYTFTSGQILDSFLGTSGGVPEPTTWALMIGGFGFIGGAMRRRAAKARVAFA